MKKHISHEIFNWSDSDRPDKSGTAKLLLRRPQELMPAQLPAQHPMPPYHRKTPYHLIIRTIRKTHLQNMRKSHLQNMRKSHLQIRQKTQVTLLYLRLLPNRLSA